MRPPPLSRRSLGSIAVAVAALAAYGWWATGVPPFSLRAYVAVGAPAILLLGTGTFGSVSGSARTHQSVSRYEPLRLRWALPWLVLLLLVIALEGIGLALGGRSTAVPTLSTVIDYALSWHVVRFILFCAWLAAGWVPFLRAARTVRPDRGGAP